MDRLKEIHNFVMAQIKIFKAIPLYSEFNDGVISGLQLVKGYAESAMEMEGKKIAEVMDGNKS